MTETESIDESGATLESGTEPSQEDAGTPIDYSDDLHTFYLEVAPAEVANEFTREAVAKYAAGPVTVEPYGFKLQAPIQRIPELVRELAQGNRAIYQVVRLD